MSVKAEQTTEPLSGETTRLADEGSDKITNQVIASSRKQFASTYIAPEPSKPVTEVATKGQKTGGATSGTSKSRGTKRAVRHRKNRNKSKCASAIMRLQQYYSC